MCLVYFFSEFLFFIVHVHVSFGQESCPVLIYDLCVECICQDQEIATSMPEGLHLTNDTVSAVSAAVEAVWLNIQHLVPTVFSF
jgi:hypothetical protein